MADNATFLEQLWRALQDHDPRSLYQTANYYCMYGAGVVAQPGFPDFTYTVHCNWLFFPLLNKCRR